MMNIFGSKIPRSIFGRKNFEEALSWTATWVPLTAAGEHKNKELHEFLYLKVTQRNLESISHSECGAHN